MSQSLFCIVYKNILVTLSYKYIVTILRVNIHIIKTKFYDFVWTFLLRYI